MIYVGKKTVLLAALTLLAGSVGMLQAQQPTFYWTKDYQLVNIWNDNVVISARNNQNQSDEYPERYIFPWYEDLENILIQDEYSASVPGASAYGTFDAYYYGSNDNPSDYEFGTDICGTLGGSVTNPGNASAESRLRHNGSVYGSATLCSESGTETTCQLAMDVNWTGTSNYPNNPDYHGLEKWVYATVMIGGNRPQYYQYVDLRLVLEDSVLYVDAWTLNDYIFEVSPDPLDSLNGSFEFNPSELTFTVPVGDYVMYGVETMENEYGYLPAPGNSGPCESNTMYRVNFTILTDQ
jgi:hypothetical protein